MSKEQQISTSSDKSDSYFLFILYTVSIVCGAVLMALEIAGGRLLSPFFGSSVYVWGSIISVFLIALSGGYYFGGILADKKPNLDLLGLIIVGSGVLILLIPPSVSSVVRFSYSSGMGNYGALFVSLVLFSLPSLGLGVVSPYVVRLGMYEVERLGKIVGRFYSVSTFGSIIGTLGSTFVLIPLFGVRKIIFSLGIVLLVLASLIFLTRYMFKTAVAALVLCVIVLVSSVYFTPEMALSLERGRTVYSKESMYNNLAVVDAYDGLRYLMFNETEQSAMNETMPNDHIWPYTYVMTAAADYYKPNAKKELLIGLGGGTIPKYTLDKRPNVSMDSVEIDPEVIKVAQNYFFMDDSPRLKNVVEDGRVYLKDKKNEYDVILIDAYNRQSIPFHLTTREFFEELSNALKPDGVVVFNVVAGIEGKHGIFLKSLLKTSDRVFSSRRIFQAEFRNSPEDMNNLILVVSKKELPSEGVLAGAKEYTDPIDLSNSIVLTDDYAPVENLAVSIMTKDNLPQ